MVGKKPKHSNSGFTTRLHYERAKQWGLSEKELNRALEDYAHFTPDAPRKKGLFPDLVQLVWPNGAIAYVTDRSDYEQVDVRLVLELPLELQFNPQEERRFTATRWLTAARRFFRPFYFVKREEVPEGQPFTQIRRLPYEEVTLRQGRLSPGVVNKTHRIRLVRCNRIRSPYGGGTTWREALRRRNAWLRERYNELRHNRTYYDGGMKTVFEQIARDLRHLPAGYFGEPATLPRKAPDNKPRMYHLEPISIRDLISRS